MRVRLGSGELAGHFSDALGTAVPTRGDTGTTMPEARAADIVARLADANGVGVFKMHVDALGVRHADSLPSGMGHRHARLIERYPGKARLILRIPATHHCMGDDGRTRAPCFPASQSMVTGVRVTTKVHARIRRFGAPGSPAAEWQGSRCTKFRHDRQCIGMAFKQLDQ